jgi:predicted methyltransferase
LKVSTRWLVSWAVLPALACAPCDAPPPASAPAPAAAEAHAHEHAEPLVHRFTDAERWSKVFDDPARDAWQKPDAIVQAMKIAPGMTACDIGAGTGYFEPYLSRAVGEKGVVLAVDIEPSMVRWLAERGAREHWSNVRAQAAEIADPKLPPRGVDRVLVVDTWHHLPERASYGAKVRAALAPGGTLTIVEYTEDAPEGPPKHHRIAPATLLGELRAAGFAAEVVDLALPYQYVVVAR